MFELKHEIYLVKIFTILFLIFSFEVQAQKNQTYNGPCTLKNGIEGNCNFQFILDKNDTIKQGNFNFINIDENKETFEAVEIKGFYNNNLKNGKWEYGFKNIKKGPLYSLENNTLIYSTSGFQKTISGTYSAGNANGNWFTLEQKIENSEPSDTLSFVKTNYSTGRIVGEIIAFNKDFDLIGFTNKEGFADKNWTIQHKKTNATEIRVYDNGILKEHCFAKNGDTTICRYVDFEDKLIDSNFWENIDMTKKYFKLLNFNHLGIEINKKDIQDTLYSVKIENTNNFILQTFNNLTENNSFNIGNFIDGSNSLEKVKVKVIKQPFSNEEKNQIKKSQELYNQNKSLVQDFFNNSDIELNKYTNEDLMIHYEVMSVFKKNQQNLAPFLEKVSKPEFEYINRSAFFQQAIPSLVYNEKIKYIFKEKEGISTYLFSKLNSIRVNNFETLIGHLTEMNNELKKLQKTTNSLLVKSAKELDLVPQEKQMIALKDSINKLYSNEYQSELFNIYHKQVSDNVLQFTEREVKNYSELGLEEKLEGIKIITSCFENTLKFYDVQAEIPRKIERLDEVYTRTVFNPYTFTNMDERIKERLYKAYENHLLPFVLNDLNIDFSCNSLELKLNNFEKLYRKMMILRDRDTKEIEKELRRENNPIKIMEILELEIYVN